MPLSQIVAASLDSAQNGSAPIYGARAWVNFNGTGTVAIRGSGNVSSITDNGTGNYTVNFTTAMVDANYSVTIGASYLSGSRYANRGFGTFSTSASACLVLSGNASGDGLDSDFLSIGIFR